MTYDHKKWTKEDVDRLIANIDHEDAKKDEFAFNYYLDENDDIQPPERAIFIVLEWVRADKLFNIKLGTVRGTKRMGWFWDAFKARKRREEYGDVDDHCLISRDEARGLFAEMGLNVEDGEQHIIELSIEADGYPPIMLPEDPKWRARRDAARARRRLPPIND